ncbi:PQQ-binding-like beta-propeller repeat protein [Streptomyces sp. NPDC093595]|uniref:outer membrane protein assembly factor BamB family protein n=1 Tax=Streptomyces sp. NPDC093595 TaxID=3366045 RepID=UPI0038276210
MTVRVLGGRYELVSFVGRGGMGEVWEGRDRVIERRVAVKLLPHDRRDTSGARLFFREARTAGSLSHPGVVTVFDLGQDPDDGTLYLVMEFLTGRDVDTVLREDGVPGIAAAVDWTAQTAAALQAAHAAGVVHRDLKPANLMLAPDGHLKILDFGIARYMASTHRSSKVIGTLAYMPPERFGDAPADARSDLYSLGCVLHELLTGHPPFRATEPVALMAAHLNTYPQPPSRARPGVPAALDDLVMGLLAKDPQDRPSSAAEVCRRLREPASAPPALAPPPGTSITTGPTITTITTGQTGPPGTPGPTGTPGTPGTETKPTAEVPLPRPGDGTARISEPVPEQAAVTPAPARRRISRRAALGLGIGATVGAGFTTALALAGDPDPDPRQRWRFTTGNAVTSSPTVVRGVVYVGSDDKNVYALEAATGAKKWAYATGHKVEAAPTVADGVVYVGSLDSAVYALDAARGHRKWAYATGDAVHAAAAVAGGVVYAGGYSGVHALHAVNGTKKWAYAADWGYGAPTVADGVVYIGSAHSLSALDAATGQKRWELRTDDLLVPPVSSPTVADGVVYVGTYRAVLAVDAATGKKQWEFGADRRFDSAPALARGVVYIGGYDGGPGGYEGGLFALDAATGKKRWEFRIRDILRSSPAVAGGWVYVGGFDGSVHAVDAATGNRTWTFTTGGRVRSSPTVADGVVYVGSNDRNVYALDASPAEVGPDR